MTAEPPLVVERRKELTYLLCLAAELEHGLMCEYLYAVFSLKTAPGPGLSPEQLRAVEVWRESIWKICREEMLHWAMVQNLLSAVGSAPYLGRPHMPHQARGYPPGIQLRLLPFGATALQHFAFLERPKGAGITDPEGFEPVGVPQPPMKPDEIVPRAQDFDRPGHLYRSIEAGFVHLAAKLGEERLFIGPAFHQADESAFSWPELRPITDLSGAIEAVGFIVEQGEGATGAFETAHFGRFMRILDEYSTIRSHDAVFDPAYPVVGAGMRAVEGIEPDVYITEPAVGGCSDLFNAVYELVLQLVARYFVFGHETAEQRRVLARSSVFLMLRVIKPLGHLLARLPVGPDHSDATAGPNFQLPHRGAFLHPHRRSAWLRFSERLEELAGFAADLDPPEGHEVLAAASRAMREMAWELDTHIEEM